MAKKSKCEMCDKKKYLFSVTKGEREVQACSTCITDGLLTGWSKQMSEFEKSQKDLIATFVATGYSEEQATEMVNKMFGVIK